MGRPVKIGLDYFPLDVNIDDNLELIEAEHGLSGFAIVVKLWQKIYSNGYYIEWNPDSVLLFSKKINSELTLINSVLNSCFIRKIFDKNLYERYGILTSSGIQKRYLLACSQSKRKSIIFYSEFKLINSEFTELITEEMRFIQEESTQSKVKESKVKETKEYNKLFLSEIKISDFPELNEKYFEAAKSFQMLFKENLNQAGASTKKIDAAKGSWIDDIRLTIEADGYTFDDLRLAYKFLQKDEFWKKNILSTSKLREKMDKIKLQLNGTYKSNSKEATSWNELAEIIDRAMP